MDYKRKLQSLLDLDSEMDPIEYSIEEMLPIACERIVSQKELRAIIVDLLGFMDRETVGQEVYKESVWSEGYYYEIKRRAKLIKDFIPPDSWTRRMEERNKDQSAPTGENKGNV